MKWLTNSKTKTKVKKLVKVSQQQKTTLQWRHKDKGKNRVAQKNLKTQPKFKLILNIFKTNKMNRQP